MRFPFLAAISLFFAAAASGQQLGQTKEAIVASNGPAIEENHAKNTAVYRSGPWKIDIVYADGIAKKLTFTQTDSLTDDEIHSILANNANGAVWREIGLSGGTRMWQRSDLATAQCDRIKPHSISMTAPSLRPRSNAASAISILPPIATRHVSPRTSSPNGTLPVTSKSTSSSPGDAFAGFVAPLFMVCFAAVLLKIVLPFRLRRGRGTALGAVRKATLPSARRASDPPPVPVQSAPTLENMNWENFELLAGEIFRRQGFDVEINSGLGADGGKDLTLRRDGEVRLVQCKRLSAKNWVSVEEMREFYGLVMAENAKRGIFMTTGFYSQPAREFAEGKPIELLGRVEIERLMASVAQPGENMCIIRSWIDDFAAGARVTDPVCPRPRCRKPMKLRRGATGRAFWGCSGFPPCRGRRDARTELVRAYS
jgi:restriction system protein